MSSRRSRRRDGRERADSATIARLRAELRLDDPLPLQFGHYLWGVVRGDLGHSYITQRPVLGDLAERFPKTLQLAGAAMLLAATVGITLGMIAAVRPTVPSTVSACCSRMSACRFRCIGWACC